MVQVVVFCVALTVRWVVTAENKLYFFVQLDQRFSRKIRKHQVEYGKNLIQRVIGVTGDQELCLFNVIHLSVEEKVLNRSCINSLPLIRLIWEQVIGF